MKIWIEHFPAKKASKGLAEIYVDGGAMKYLTRTCIGRIYQKHLPKHTADRIIQEIEKTITRTDFLSSFNSENAENGKKSGKKAIFSESDIVYIAGPMTGKTLFNYPAFYGFAGLIEKEYGCRVINPARQPNGLTYDEYLRRAVEDVKTANAILLLSGWESSKGARREFNLAAERNIRIVYESQIAEELKTRIVVK